MFAAVCGIIFRILTCTEEPGNQGKVFPVRDKSGNLKILAEREF